jgi:hypothetical protein
VSWEGIRGLDYFPTANSENNFLGAEEEEEDEDEEEGHGQSLVSSMASSITSLSLAHSHGGMGVGVSMGQSYGAAMSMGGSFNVASSLASTCSSGHNSHNQVSFEQSEVSSSPYNVRILEKRSRQYSVGSAGSW